VNKQTLDGYSLKQKDFLSENKNINMYATIVGHDTTTVSLTMERHK
jgi:hypothetical protein